MADDNSQSKTSAKASGGRRPPSSPNPHVTSAQRHASSHTASSRQDLQVYIPDIPLNLPENDLETRIRTLVGTILRLKISDIKCYSKLGVAVIRLMNEEDKVYLVSTVQSMVFEPQTNTNIKFMNELELDSYVVLDRTLSIHASADDVARRYMQSYRTQELPRCKSISIQFPNIFRISLSTLDELAEAVNQPDFKFENTFATVYLRADCSFFEDLPTNTNDQKLSSAIAVQIGENQLLATSFYVQYNNETGNAVVLATKSNKKWMMESFLTIDGRNVPKKMKLAYRVLVSPVAPGFNLDLILNHALFAHRIVTYSHINDHLILELDDVKTYTHCLDIGGCGVGKVLMRIAQHTVVSNPDASEVNAENWYETEMHDIKPDITTIITNHQHPIFHYKWNAENWLEQLKKLDTVERRSRKYDLDRHLLRVTVMLNTIGVLRKKKYTVDGKEVTLKLQRMRTIGYDHKAKLSYGKTIPQTELKTPYPSTSVMVVNEDCLVLYEKLVNEGYRPLLLNMANATSPGGGYRKGDGAQEENLFRRSDYYQSLDLEIADRDRSERLYCTEKCEVKPPTGYAGLYPMEEFGAIYTSGITVFRQTEANGYAYMKDALYNVCSIAMAAYRDPALTNKNMLEKKFATNTYKKIDNIFAIGHRHEHDCLVLSALGCGAFKNPPEHIAFLFKSAIYKYAGYFKTIYFAIVDDHNTGNHINPKGNFLPFKQILDNLIVKPPKTMRVNGASGPYRILKKLPDGKITLSDACIQHLPPCYHGTQCRNMKDAQHVTSFSHPPVCSYQDSNVLCDQMNDEVHMFTFTHSIKCKHGGECTITDAQHLNDFDHPEFCKNKSDCPDVSSEHLFTYRHLPACPDGLQCLKYLRRTPEHLNDFRHCKTFCSYDNCCSKFHDKEHIQNTIHSFRQPCPFTPYKCSMFVSFIQSGNRGISRAVEEHCLTFSHVCQYGRQCRTTDERHYEISIHVARQFCPDRDQCFRLTDENHLESFSHPDIRDIRLLCDSAGFECRTRYQDKHLSTYRHGRNFNHLSVAPSSNLNSSIDFFQNQGQIIRTVNHYINASNWKKAKISPDILNWIKALQPVHRCGPNIFASILVHGHVMSRHYMGLLTKPRCVAKAVMQHKQVRSIFLRNNIPAVKQNAEALIKLLVRGEFLKAGSPEVTSLDADHDNRVKIIEQRLKPPLDQRDLQAIHDWTVKIAVASVELSTHLAGIGFEVDKKLGTDQHVFSILGPHRGFYYGDIVITFKQEIMFHPDANFSFQAGTSFHSGRVYTIRSWWTDPGSVEKRIEHFYHSKLHCSYPRYEYAAATELIAFTGQAKQAMDVDLNSVLNRWNAVDSHDVFEGHLPPLIPLDYIDNVYMPKNLFESLPKEVQTSAKEMFKSSLIIAEHDVDLSLIKPGSTLPLDDSRKPYLKYILEKISQKIDERIEVPHISRGIVITVPGTRFDEQIVLPMTIKQSYDLYCLNKGPTATDLESTIIYWQAMNGDMMLTISNEKIESDGKDQPNLQCLVCYVAEKPSTATDHYHEEYSYLNVGHPSQHSNNVHSAHFKAKSNCFYHGCNTDDFFTFCLKITYKTGEVSLSHAGPNGIYNHEKISYQFKSSEIDLSKIKYIHVSAGNQDVPIRNLTINHEPIPELHPTVDKDFTIDTSGLVNKRRASFHYTGGSADRVEEVRSAARVKEVPSAGVTPKPAMGRAASTADITQKPVDPPPPTEVSFLRKLKHAMLGKSKKKNPLAPQPPTSNTPTDDQSRSASSPYSPARSGSLPYNPARSDSPPPQRRRHDSPPSQRQRRNSSSPSSSHSSAPRPLLSSTLPPCPDSIYCLHQNSRDHTNNYSHPCRFNELCLKQASEPHLVHKRHNVSICLDDKNCSKLSDPVHRAKHRHTELPDYLIPCHYQDTCYDKKDPDHRKRFFHGEEIPSIKKTRTPTIFSGDGAPRTHLTPCIHGNECRSMKNPQHMAKFSHPSS